MSDTHKLVICLPDKRQLEIGPMPVSEDSDVSCIDKRIKLKFATNKSHWKESVLIIEHRNFSYRIPYEMFTSGKAYWFVEETA